MRRFSFHEVAEAELAEAARYYEARSRGLGKQFLAKVRGEIDTIRRFPEAAPLVRGSLRCKPVRGFPYSLIFALEADDIRIYAVKHHRRRPGYWLGHI